MGDRPGRRDAVTTGCFVTYQPRDGRRDRARSIRNVCTSVLLCACTSTSVRLRGTSMALSIRNQLSGSVTDIATGGAMATVKVGVEGGQLTAAITKDAVDDLGLAGTHG
ncbi:TOBE domain-containing protein [Streptomyces cyaneofuscatus]